jgi:cell division GTPase FtsZ
MKAGIMGFGQTGKRTVTFMLESKIARLEWVARRSHELEHVSAAEIHDLAHLRHKSK